MKKMFLLLVVSASLALPAYSANSPIFTNPAKLEPLQPCTTSNIRVEKFPSAKDDFKIGACQSLDRVVAMLNSPVMSDQLREKSRALWDTFLSIDVNLQPMKKDVSDKVYGLVEVYEANPRVIRMTLYLNPKRLNDPVFNYAFMHELQHVADYHDAWVKKGLLSSYDTEMNAFRVTSYLAQEMEPNKKLAKDSLFWDDKWSALSEAERVPLRDAKIEKFLKSCGIYKSKSFNTKDVFDFSMIIRPDPPKSARLEKEKDKNKKSQKEDS